MSTIINATTTNGVVIQPDNSGSLQLATNSGTTAVTISTAQNVGIGTASPAYKLDVSGNIGAIFANPDVSGIIVQATTGTNAAAMKFNNTGGNFFVGKDSSNGTRISGTAYANCVWGETAYPTVFGTNNVERMRIDTSGNLQVGMTAGTYRLNVKYTDNNQLWLDNDGSTSTGMVYANNGTSKVQLYWHNSLARYYITAVSAGVFLASGGTSWTSASDERVKDIIEPIENATAKLANWRTVIGKYKTDEEGTRRSFLIAQDVQTTFPEAVDTTNAEEFGLRYQDTIPVLVKAIQEQQTIINDLKARIETLEAK